MRSESVRFITVLQLILILLLSVSCHIRNPVPGVTMTPQRTRIVVPTPIPELTPTPNPTIVDSSLAYGIPCKPPCWQNLIPGKTTREEAAQLLKGLLASGGAGHVLDIDESGAGLFVVLSESGKNLASVRCDDGIVKSILGDLEFDYTISELIEAFGPPGQVSRNPPHLDPGSCSVCPKSGSIKQPFYDVYETVVYPEQGLSFLIAVPTHLNGCLCPEMQVHSFCYYVPQSAEDGLNNGRGVCYGATWAGAGTDWIKWRGFGGGY